MKKGIPSLTNQDFMECHVMEHPFFSQEFLRTCHQDTQDFCREAFGGGFGVRWCFVVFNDETKYNKMRGTPAKFNMEPENDGFQNESPFPGTSFQVSCEISGVYPLNKLGGKRMHIGFDYTLIPVIFSNNWIIWCIWLYIGWKHHRGPDLLSTIERYIIPGRE